MQKYYRHLLSIVAEKLYAITTQMVFHVYGTQTWSVQRERMIKCTLCKRDAILKDKKPIIKGREKHYLFYCGVCATNGIAFGFLEKEELESV